MKKREKTLHALLPVVSVFLGLLDLGIILAWLLKGTDIELFHPKGYIAQQELRMFVISGAVLLAIGLPAIFLFYFFAWKYRETNTKATYDPSNHHGKYFVFTIWAIPCFFMLVMASIMWTSTHKLDPHTPISSNVKPLTVQVVALRWKWLFIYPDQNIATVNYVRIPTDTPIKFELTADDAPMSSFWIPHLSGQLYAMTGMVNTLNVMASDPGQYQGSSAEINGAGFAGMKFVTQADTQAGFDQWVSSVQQDYNDLDAATYEKLVQPSEDNKQQYYANPQPGLYDAVVMKYMGANHDMTQVGQQ